MSSLPSTGQQLIGSEQEVNGYRFEKIIGRDVAGRFVFRAINYRHEKKAVKILAINIQNVDKALSQAILMSSIIHPNITQSYEFMIRKETSQLLIFSEYCEENMAKCFKAISDHELVKYALQIMNAVQYLHESLNMTHNDIRMESIQLLGKERKPKLSFYNIDWMLQSPREVYMSDQLSEMFSKNNRITQLQYKKSDDMWALGLLILELFSRKRITQLCHQYPHQSRGMPVPAFRQSSFNSRAIFQELKFTKIQGLVKTLLEKNAAQRLTIGNFKKLFIAAVQSKDFAIIRTISKKQILYNREDPALGNFVAPNFKRRGGQQKYEEIIQRTSRKANTGAFRLDDVKEKSKLKILNLSDMKIVKIEPIFNLMNLEWLYLENNIIGKIENLDYPRLKGLNLGNNKITKIEGLDRLTSLEELYLQNNEIEKIENLQELRNLKWLYLNHNKVSIIQNLQSLTAIKTVALKQNPIDEFRDVNAQALRLLKEHQVQVILY